MSVKSKQKNNSKQFHMEKKRNLWVIPTDNPSRLFYNVGGALLFTKWDNYNGVNIYITSDEYIGLSYYLDGNLVRKGVIDDKEYWEVRKDYKKIILTTDQDLIKDGVQAIDNEFLEWFVKNPSCEEVGVKKLLYKVGSNFEGNRFDGYKIIIPKEEAKQDLEKEMFELEQELDIPSHLRWHNSKAKQETLEEVARNYRDLKLPDDLYDGFIAGAKWQAKRMYSEEDMLEFSEWVSDNDWVYLPSKGCWVNEEEEESEEKFTTKELFNKFKKK